MRWLLQPFWANQQLCPLLLSKIYLYIAARKCIQCFLLNSFITCLAPSPKAEEPWLVRAAKPHTILTHRQIGKYRVRFSTVTSAECMIPHLQIYQPISYFPIHMPLSCVMYLQLQLLYIKYQEPTQRHENIEYFCMFRIHMFFEKGIPQEVVIHRCSHRFCDINTESTLFRGKSEHIQRHFLSYHIITSNLYQIIIIVLDEVLRRRTLACVGRKATRNSNSQTTLS